MASESLVKTSYFNFLQQLYGKTVDPQSSSIGNIFFSPLSIYGALAMILAGSADGTRSELLKAMQLPESFSGSGDHHVIGNVLMSCFNPTEDLEVHLANKLFVDGMANILSEYKSLLKSDYKAESGLVDFQKNAESARAQINNWVGEMTSRKITELIPKGAVDAKTVAVITNALYFKGLWKQMFDATYTKESTFYLLDGTEKMVSLMHRSVKLEIAQLQHVEARAIRIPFSNSKWDLMIVLPHQNSAFPKVLAHLQKAEGFSSLLGESYFEDEIELYLPKFKLGGQGDLDVKAILQKLGVKSLFDQSAKLTGISPHELYISDIRHKAVLEVDEEGARAAASTAVLIQNRMMRTFTMKVNRPFFVILLYDKQLPVFIGHVVDPEPF